MNAQSLRLLLNAWASLMAENRERLIELDSVAGDSDLGLTMTDGFRAAAKAAAESPESDLGKLSYQAGKAMASAVPSTMGTLMASGLMNAGKVLKGKEELAESDEADFFQAYFDGVQSRGKAALGDKTFLDAFSPAVVALQGGLSQGRSGKDAANAANEAAQKGYEATKGMLARQGRLAIRGEASRELPDPGAAVAVLLMQGYADIKNR